MKAGEFLKPETKKFILPATIIIIFIYTISVFAGMGIVLDEHTPETIAFIGDLVQETSIQNLSMDVVVERLREGFRPINEELAKHSGPVTKPLIMFITAIDPLFPIPCEISTSTSCRYYLSKSSYRLLFNTGISNILLASPVTLDKFQNVTLTDYSVNMLLLFVEGYLISCIALFLYRRRKKEPWHRRIFNIGR